MLTGSGFAPPVSIDIPTLDEMYYDPMKARPTRNPPSARALLMARQKNSGGPGARGAVKYKGSQITPDVRSLARGYTKEGIKILASIMRNESNPAMSRVAAVKLMLDRGWGSASQTHKIDISGETSLLKVVNEIVHVHETREQIEFRDQTPLLELVPEDSDDNGSKSQH